jgi:vesicle-associated membrane protein 4
VELLKGQVDQVKGVMNDNFKKVNERGVQLDVLDDKADNLQNEALLFEKQAKQLKRKHCLKNFKLWIILISIIIIIVIVIVGAIGGGLAYHFITTGNNKS